MKVGFVLMKQTLLKILGVGALILWSSTGCYSLAPESSEPAIPLGEIQADRHLLHAVQTSVPTFLTRVLNARPRKVIGVGQWQVLHQDEAFVYYGYPVLQHLFSEAREVRVLYKVSRYQLERLFPNFENWRSQPKAQAAKVMARAFALQPMSFDYFWFRFDPESPDRFYFETNVHFDGLTVPCRYGVELTLPGLKTAGIEQLPIRQLKSDVCPTGVLN